ncbi:MAG: polysaccharide biosynthesis tyrosine autokinase [Lautropia sp.]|nr:polysaccharide biosynthesis tyrosine autokinase [Lautropia sp.]
MNMSNPFPNDDAPGSDAPSPSVRPGTPPRQAAPTFSTYLAIIRERKWLVLGTAIIVTILATVIVNLMTPIYRASATILIENSKRNVISFEEIYGVPAGSREFFQTQAEFMRSREVGIRVVKSLDLVNNPLFNRDLRGNSGEESAQQSESASSTETPTTEQQAAGQGVSAEAGINPYLSEDALEEQVLARYKANLDIVPVKNSQLVEIRFESPDPVLAAKVANQTAESYITADLDARFDMQQTASRWLNERLNQLRTDLETAEANLQAYREEIGLVATPSSTLGGNERQLDTSSDRLIAARVERSRAEQIYRQVARGARNRYEVPEVFNNAAVVSARTAVSAAEQRMADIAGSLGPSHPAYKAAQSELDQARANLRRQSENVIASIAKAYEVAVQTEKALEKEVASSKGNIQEINRKEGRLNVLQRDVATAQQIYQTFLARVKETDATADFQNPIARVVDPAVPPIMAVKPPKPQIILLAAVIGTLLGAMLAISRDQKNAVVRSSDEVFEKLGAPLLVAVPKLPAEEAAKLPHLQQLEPQSLFAESIRSALTGVRLSLMNVSRPVISFTSTLPGEGKSTTACSFAIEQARTKQTVLIDADIRKPSIRRMLGIPEGQKGLSDIFTGEPIENCIVYMHELNLWVITAGSNKTKHSHDLLMSPRFGEIIEQLKERFELVIIDTPPLEMVSDALPIGLQSTGLIYVVKAGETLIPLARRGLDRLSAANVRILGVVLNNHDFEKAGRYYGEYSAYGEAYGQGYYGANHKP